MSCGGGGAPAGHGGGSELDSLAREIEGAERELDRELGPNVAAAPSATPPPGNEGAAAAEEAKKSEPAPETPVEPSAPPTSTQAPPPCKVACRALESMRRSATRICELAGAEHERCTWARQKLGAAEARVQRAACECGPTG